MSELRRDPVVDRWVIITDDPTLSPAIPQTISSVPEDPFCPFCPGNEHLCPPEILANRQGGSPPNSTQWKLRVIPNRSPLLVVEEDLKRMGEGMYDKVTGVGANEVIIETPVHARRQADMDADELENVFWAYRDRIVSETGSFLAIEPFAPRVPFETWIIPKRHSSRFEEIDSKEVGDLAAIFRDVLLRLDRALNRPAYNYALHNAPFDKAYDRVYHWHMEITPRIGIQGGLRMGFRPVCASDGPRGRSRIPQRHHHLRERKRAGDR